jgi:hypothetical protein
MNKTLITVAALAAAFAGAAHAGEADPSGQFALQIKGERTRAEVNAEAVKYAATHSTEPNGMRPHAVLNTGVQAADVRAQAVQAVRLGQISYGEASARF